MFTGDDIIRKRKADGLTAIELADLLQVSVANLYKWQKGARPTDTEDYIKIENWLNEKIENNSTSAKNAELDEDYEKLYISELKDKIRILQDHNSFLARNFEVSLSAIHQTTIAQLAHQKALAWYQASNVAKGDPEKTEKEIVKLNNKVAEFAGLKSEKGNPVHS